jgi:hypothetical protein
MTDATLRYHAHNVAMHTADYSYYKSDSTGLPVKVADGVTINEVVDGQNWDTVTLEPRFIGQDLADQTPAPIIRYTSSNTAVAGVTSAGVVTYNAVGEATISVELLDMDGKSHGVAKEIPVTVAERPEPEPEPDPEPDEPEEPASTLGTFSLEVINTIEINGEKVDICRWVWTPLNKQ